MTDIFISYAREDTDFVRKLYQALLDNERDVWVDFDDIPFGTDWWQEIVHGIEHASTGIFIISPDSIQSQYCSLELQELIKNNKKIVPIVARESGDLIYELPDAVREINWIPFQNDDEFDTSFEELITALDTDFEAARQHTKLLIRATNWQRSGHSIDTLTRGDELASFLPMIERDDLTVLQQSFLGASLRAAQARYNLWRFIFGFLGGFLAMAFYIALAFRATSITPLLVTNIIAAGQVFGFFTGVIALFGSGLPEFLKRRIPVTVYTPVRIAVMILAGMLTWTVYQWFFLNLPLIPTWASFFGGIAIAIGFIINSLFRPPAIVTFIITFAAFFSAIYLLNTFTGILGAVGLTEPLIYFDSVRQVYSIGLPMAALYAMGTNAHILWQAIQSGSEVTAYLENRTAIMPRKQKHVIASQQG